LRYVYGRGEATAGTDGLAAREIPFAELAGAPLPDAIHLTAVGVKEGGDKTFVLARYEDDPTLCPVRALWSYLDDTLSKRASRSSRDRLFVTTRAPFRSASEVTLGNWVRAALSRAGANAAPHSSRAVASSEALRGGADLDDVLRAANWSGVGTFRAHYYLGHEALPANRGASSASNAAVTRAVLGAKRRRTGAPHQTPTAERDSRTLALESPKVTSSV
jgi:hypothetical protein